MDLLRLLVNTFEVETENLADRSRAQAFFRPAFLQEIVLKNRDCDDLSTQIKQSVLYCDQFRMSLLSFAKLANEEVVYLVCAHFFAQNVLLHEGTERVVSELSAESLSNSLQGHLLIESCKDLLKTIHEVLSVLTPHPGFVLKALKLTDFKVLFV